MKQNTPWVRDSRWLCNRSGVRRQQLRRPVRHGRSGCGRCRPRYERGSHHLARIWPPPQQRHRLRPARYRPGRPARHLGGPVADTGPIGQPDTPVSTCATSCTTDAECQSTCPAAPAGSANCCDTATSACFQSVMATCPGSNPTHDGGGHDTGADVYELGALAGQPPAAQRRGSLRLDTVEIRHRQGFLSREEPLLGSIRPCPGRQPAPLLKAVTYRGRSFILGRSTNTLMTAAQRNVARKFTGARTIMGSSPCATKRCIRLSMWTVTMGFTR